MKRILMSIFLAVIVSMFFTGCNSIILSVGEDDFVEIPWQEMEKEYLDEIPDYYENNETNKFENLTGNRAFKIKQGHSEASTDIADFQIGTLLNDGTFIYAYSTKESGEGDDRKSVHCAAAYNYKNGQMKIIHEKMYESIDDADELGGGESFYIQICDETSPETSDIFIYDNGIGYIYSANGSVKFKTDIETFIRSRFHKAYSVETVNAVTDGNNRIFLELVIEKEPIDIGEDLNKTFSEEEADRELEALEKEFEEKTTELVLVYNFKEIETTIDQDLLNVDTQAMYWKSMTAAHGPYTTAPDVWEDWATIQTSIPDQWGYHYLGGLENRPVLYKWKTEPVFQYTDDDYICTFQMDITKISDFDAFYTLEENKALSNTFIYVDDTYYEVFGTASEYYYKLENVKTYTRSYTYQWTETELDADGNPVEVTKTEDREQTIYVPTYRYYIIDGGYLEGYQIGADIEQIVGCFDGNIALVSGPFFYWIVDDAKANMVSLITDKMLIDMGSDGERVYTLLSTADKTMILEGNSDGEIKEQNLIENNKISNAVSAKSLTPSSVGQKYYDMYHSQFQDDFGDLLSFEQITGDKVLKASVTVNKNALKELDTYGVLSGADTATGEGYLLTTFNKGLLYYDLGSQEAVTLNDGTWYRTWKQGDKYIAVGFSDSDASYGIPDIAFSRIYEFDVDSLYQESVEEILESAKTIQQQ